MAYRARELTLENINRVFLMIQKDIVRQSSTTLPSGESATTIDLSPITGSLDQVIARVSVLEGEDARIHEALALKAEKNNTINAYPIGNNPILDGTDLLMGNGDDDTVYDAVKAAQAIFNIVGSASTYSSLPNPSTVASGGVYVVLQDETRNNQQTLYRRTAGAQWLFTGLFSINLSIYYTKGEADVLLARNSTEDQGYTDRQLNREVVDRDSAIAAEHREITVETANAISESQAALRREMLELIGFSLSNYVPNTRQVNGKALYSDIVIDTHDIAYKDLTLNQFLALMTGSLLYKGSVETEADLPDPVGLQNGIVYNVLDTMSLMLASEGTWQYFGKIAINLADYYSKEETYSRAETDNNIGKAKGEVTDELHEWVLQFHAEVVTAQANAVSLANGHTDNRFDNDIFPKFDLIDEEIDDLQLGLGNKVDKTYPHPFVSNVSFSQDAAEVSINLTRYYLDTTGLDRTVSMPMVSSVMAGFMPASDHNAIGNLQTRVASLEASGVYIGQSFSTYAEMMGTPINPNWTVNDFTFVQDDESQGDHATEYILVLSGGVLGWAFARFDDIDIPDFTETTPGIITSSIMDGHVTATAEHTGKVAGWGDLKTRVSNAEGDIVTLGNKFATDVPVTASIAGGLVTLLQKAETITNAEDLANATYVDDAVSAHAAIKGISSLGHVYLAASPGALNIATDGALSHKTGEGNSHLPAGGEEGNALKKGAADNTYVWSALREVPETTENGKYLRSKSEDPYYEWQDLETLRTVPTGGTKGQALLKGEETAYGWETIRQVPEIGNVGMFLMKDITSRGYGWNNLPINPVKVNYLYQNYAGQSEFTFTDDNILQILYTYTASGISPVSYKVNNMSNFVMAYIAVMNGISPRGGYVAINDSIVFPTDGSNATNPMVIFLKGVQW
jgi:hypothetical protein